MYESLSGKFLSPETFSALATTVRGSGNCRVTQAEGNVSVRVDEQPAIGPASTIFWIKCTGSQLMDSEIQNYRYSYSWTEVTPTHSKLDLGTKPKSSDYTVVEGPTMATESAARRSGSVTINPAFNMAELNHTIQPGPAKPWMVYQHDINNTTNAYPPNHKPCRPGTFNLEGVVSHNDDFVTIGYEMTDPETNEVVTWFDKMGTHQGPC